MLDRDPGPALRVAPPWPGRPAHLRLEPAPDARAGRSAPREGQLADAGARGRLLHAFAHHELLALELFALALLRFPAAPPAFRQGLVGVMAEEQAHLRAYLERMEALGVRFGDEPPSAFFWSALAPVDAPERFLAGLSLTFEQANLDFAAHFAGVMRRVGDLETAALLERVLADEIGHVRHGLSWFERWRDPASSCWEAWTAALPPPLVPRRARGRGPLQREARLAAGLPEDFLRRLALAGESTGRTPVVHAFLPGFEDELAGQPPSPAARRVAADLGALPVFLARTGDVVVVPTRPSLAWLESLTAAGLTLPELLVGSLPEAVATLAGRPLSGLAPWGWGPGARQALAPLFGQVRPGPFAGVPDAAHGDALPGLASKAWAAERLGALLTAHPEWAPVVGPEETAQVGRVCRDEPSLRAALDRVQAAGAPGPQRAVVKAPFGTSGRGALRLDGPPDPAQTTWLRRTLARQGSLVVEPWLTRVADLSVQLELRGPGEVRLRGVTRFLADRRGQYAGHLVGPCTAGLPPEALRLLTGHEEGAPSGLEVLAAVGQDVGRALAAAGHRGPAGIDALLFRDRSGRLRLRPLVEVNPRTTMGTVALALERRLAPGRLGLWLHVPLPQARQAGHADLPALAAAARAALPIETSGTPPRLCGGALCTNDPVQAAQALGLLIVAADGEGCLSGLARLGLAPPPPV